jgi:hypothetical protein
MFGTRRTLYLATFGIASVLFLLQLLSPVTVVSVAEARTLVPTAVALPPQGMNGGTAPTTSQASVHYVSLTGIRAVLTAPDLTPTNVSAPSPAATGRELQVSWEVLNQGGA